jgi:hypothetical protein
MSFPLLPIAEKRASRLAMAHLSAKERAKIAQQTYKTRHPGRLKEIKASWSKENQKKINAQCIIRYAANREKGLTYYQQNKERLKKDRRARYAATKLAKIPSNPN